MGLDKLGRYDEASFFVDVAPSNGWKIARANQRQVILERTGMVKGQRYYNIPFRIDKAPFAGGRDRRQPLGEVCVPGKTCVKARSDNEFTGLVDESGFASD